MLKEAIEKIAALATPETYVIGDDTYTTASLKWVAPHIDRPRERPFSSLDGIVKAVIAEIDMVTRPVFINVESHNVVSVFTTYRPDNMQRDELYRAVPDLPAALPTWMGYDDAMIALRSRFIETEDSMYILDLLSSISDDNSVKTTDNGLTQMVNVKQGVSLQEQKKIKPRVRLKPFRTFLEVDQPESEFLLRMQRGEPDKGKEAKIGLFEADGGAWKLVAKHNVAEYFREHLAELTGKGDVIITE